MEERTTLVTIYESNSSIGYTAPFLKEENTVETYMMVIATLEYVKEKVLRQLDPELED